MKKRSKEHLKNLGKGHEYGWGRASEAHGDKRTKRRRTRREAKKEAMKGW